jgi:hypothetical protein
VATSSVNTTTSAYDTMAEDWKLIRDLMGGTRTMRAAGEAWLPQEPSEEDDTTGALYEARLNRTILFNGFRKSVSSMAGAVFRSPLTLSEDMPEKVVEFKDDIDLQGSQINTFARRVFGDALAVGLSHILVDHPRGSDESKTKAEEKAAGARPYWIHVPAERLIGWRSENRDGLQVLTEARIRETVMEPDGKWGEKAVAQVRVLRPGSFEVYREGKNEWSKVEDGKTSLDYIPLVTIQTDATGFMTARPPLLDLAWLNLVHWQSSSDQRNILHVARVPILSFMGFDDEDCKSVTIGPLTGIRSTRTDARVSFVEHSGKAIDAGRDDLKDTEERMAVMGVELLVSRTGTRDFKSMKTATQTAVEATQAESALSSMAQSLENGIDLAFEYTADFLGVEPTGETHFDASLRLPFISASDFDTLLKLREIRELSGSTLLEEFRRRGLLPDTFDIAKEAEKLAAEKKAVTPLTRLPLGDATNA